MKKVTLGITILISTLVYSQDVVLDTTSSLLWQDVQDNKKLSITYFEAEEYCSKLKVRQYEDFRLPTLYELQSIIDYKKYKPAIISGFKYVGNETYWTTTTFANDSEEVWTINFKKGARSVKGKHYDRNIRCVQKVK